MFAGWGDWATVLICWGTSAGHGSTLACTCKHLQPYTNAKTHESMHTSRYLYIHVLLRPYGHHIHRHTYAFTIVYI